MKVISCPKCHKKTEVRVDRAIDEHGEVFLCQHCRWPFRYAKK